MEFNAKSTFNKNLDIYYEKKLHTRMNIIEIIQNIFVLKETYKYLILYTYNILVCVLKYSVFIKIKNRRDYYLLQK